MKLTYDALCLTAFLCFTHAASAMQVNPCCINFETAAIHIGLIKLGENYSIDSQDIDGNTLLHVAISYQLLPLIHTLLRKCPHLVDIKNKYGHTPLHLAVTAGNNEIILLLRDKGADAFIENQEGVTAYELAVKSGNYTTADLLYQTKPAATTDDNTNNAYYTVTLDETDKGNK